MDAGVGSLGAGQPIQDQIPHFCGIWALGQIPDPADPRESPHSQLVKLAKRLKKEKVNVDIINFGEEVRILGFPNSHASPVPVRELENPDLFFGIPDFLLGTR